MSLSGCRLSVELHGQAQGNLRSAGSASSNRIVSLL